ncbi:unnamed protein product, partial [Discosporangium mesarthrocarpum]
GGRELQEIVGGDGAGLGRVGGTACTAIQGVRVDGWCRVGYEVVSSPGGFLGRGDSSPLRVEGLAPGVPYTFSVYELWTWSKGEEGTWAGEGG